VVVPASAETAALVDHRSGGQWIRPARGVAATLVDGVGRSADEAATAAAGPRSTRTWCQRAHLVRSAVVSESVNVPAVNWWLAGSFTVTVMPMTPTVANAAAHGGTGASPAVHQMCTCRGCADNCRASSQRDHQIPDPAGVLREPSAEVGCGRASPEWDEHDLDQEHAAGQQAGEHSGDQRQGPREHNGTVRALALQEQPDPSGVTHPTDRPHPCTEAPAIGATRWLTHRMVAPLPEPDREIDPNEPVPDDPAELLPDAPEPLPPPPVEATPDDPGGDPGGVPEPA
jgi:hypothetical protein